MIWYIWIGFFILSMLQVRLYASLRTYSCIRARMRMAPTIKPVGIHIHKICIRQKDVFRYEFTFHNLDRDGGKLYILYYFGLKT